MVTTLLPKRANSILDKIKGASKEKIFEFDLIAA